MKKLIYKVFPTDRITNGILIGLFVPIVLLGLLLSLFESLGILKTGAEITTVQILKPRTLALLAICTNVLFMQTFSAMRWIHSMRGITIATFVCVCLWLMKYLKEIF